MKRCQQLIVIVLNLVTQCSKLSVRWTTH